MDFIKGPPKVAKATSKCGDVTTQMWPIDDFSNHYRNEKYTNWCKNHNIVHIAYLGDGLFFSKLNHIILTCQIPPSSI